MRGKAWTFRKSTAAFAALLAVTLAGGSGCSSVNQQPFDKFSTAVTNTQAGTENCINLTYVLAKEDFVKGFISDPDSESSFHSLQFDFDKSQEPEAEAAEEEILAEAAREPLFVSIIHARTALQKLNAAFSAYAVLLKTLAGTKSLSPDELKALSANANAVATAAAKLSKQSLPDGTGDFIGAAFAQSADLYLKHRTKAYLMEAIRENQKAVEEYAILGAKLVTLQRETLIDSYNGKFQLLHSRWKASKTEEEKVKILEETISLNSKTTAAMELLNALAQAYQLLPQANSDLAKSLEDDDAALPWLDQLANLSKELEILHVNLSSLTRQQ